MIRMASWAIFYFVCFSLYRAGAQDDITLIFNIEPLAAGPLSMDETHSASSILPPLWGLRGLGGVSVLGLW